MLQEEAETRADATSSKAGGRKDRSEQQHETQGHREKRKCAQRELLGIGVPDPARRPLRARRSTWGLTGTPLLSSETRITELAALCGGAYVCGNAAHWRTMWSSPGAELCEESAMCPDVLRVICFKPRRKCRSLKYNGSQARCEK